MKFSIVIPVYNVEDYIEKCLNSIKIQTYSNFEAIIVNDGSPDNSEKIIKKYLKDKRFKYYKKKNGGLSDARNYGVKFATGDYLLFIDSDDYIDEFLLEKINEKLEKEQVDVIKFNVIDVIDDKLYKQTEKIEESKIVKLEDIIYFNYFEPAWSFCYSLNFYKNNNFKFEVGRYHEDYGLIPLILCKAKSIYYINYFGYYYIKREGSIVNDSTKAEKRANDALFFSIKNIEIIKNLDVDLKTKSYLLSFYANGSINKLKLLNSLQKKKYVKKLKENEMYQYLLSINYKQKIKKLMCKISYNLYIKLF